MTSEDTKSKALMPALLGNYMDKHDAVTRTAEALTKAGIGVIAAQNLHGGSK
jgi:hypothetical protein